MAAGSPAVKLTFMKPPPKMLAHGWARKKLRVATNNRVTAAQKRWLEEYCGEYEKKGSSPRHVVVYRAMVNYRGILHFEDGVAFVMTPTQIFNWLKRRWAAQKAAGINLATAAVAAAEEEDEEDEDDGGEAKDEMDGEDNDDEECDYGEMTAKQLRTLLRAKGMPTGGSKAELVARLQNEDDSDDEDERSDYDAMGVAKLRDLIRKRNEGRGPQEKLTLGGLKNDLIERLQEDDQAATGR